MGTNLTDGAMEVIPERAVPSSPSNLNTSKAPRSFTTLLRISKMAPMFQRLFSPISGIGFKGRCKKSGSRYPTCLERASCLGIEIVEPLEIPLPLTYQF